MPPACSEELAHGVTLNSDRYMRSLLGAQGNKYRGSPTEFRLEVSLSKASTGRSFRQRHGKGGCLRPGAAPSSSPRVLSSVFGDLYLRRVM